MRPDSGDRPRCHRRARHPQELKQAVSGDTVHLTFTAREDVAEAQRAIERLPAVDAVETTGLDLHFHTSDGGALLPALVRALDTSGVSVADVSVHRPTLDDVFLDLTGRSLRDDQQPTGPTAAQTSEVAA